MICETCQNSHTGEYGSSRFCSVKCSRSFSTKAKRSEISEKVSKSLTKHSKTKDCVICGIEFTSRITRTKVCESIDCRKLYRSKCLTGIKPKSGELRKKGSGGLREGGGKSKVYEYISSSNEKMFLNSEEILIANLFDELNVTWNRNNRGFKYKDEGRIRTFYPDFYVKELNAYVEYKGWVTNQMRKKMKSAVAENDLSLIIVVGSDSRFKNDGISIDNLRKRIESTK